MLISLYRVLWGVQTTEALGALYSFIPAPEKISSIFLGIIDLADTGFIIETNGESVFLIGNMIIIIGAVAAQFFQMKMISAKKKKDGKSGKKEAAQEMAERIQKQMIYFFPFFTFFILLKLPLAIGLYWLVSTLFSIIQQHFILKNYEQQSFPRD